MHKYQSILIEVIVIIIILLVPYAYHFDLGPGPNSLVAMLWELKFETPQPYFVFISPLWYHNSYNIIRALFLIITYIFLIGKIKNVYYIISGFITDLLVLLISIPAMYLLNSDGENLFPILIPIPTLFLFDLIITFIIFKIKSNPPELEFDL
jgi:hypothetical protein